MPSDPREKIQPGDWVVWSDYRDENSQAIRKKLGAGPFQVKDIRYLGDHTGTIEFKHFVGQRFFYLPRFRKDTFIAAVKEALKDA